MLSSTSNGNEGVRRSGFSARLANQLTASLAILAGHLEAILAERLTCRGAKAEIVKTVHLPAQAC